MKVIIFNIIFVVTLLNTLEAQNDIVYNGRLNDSDFKAIVDNSICEWMTEHPIIVSSKCKEKVSFLQLGEMEDNQFSLDSICKSDSTFQGAIYKMSIPYFRKEGKRYSLIFNVNVLGKVVSARLCPIPYKNNGWDCRLITN